jgi:hypothetical protein
MMITFEKTIFRLGAPHQLLMGIALGVGSFHHPPFCGSLGRRFAFLGEHTYQATLCQQQNSLNCWLRSSGDGLGGGCLPRRANVSLNDSSPIHRRLLR